MPAGTAVPAPAPANEPDTDPSALTAFRPALDPYGTWVTDSKYGTVWVPHVSAVGGDFAPYVSRGRWALTADEDWVWVSDYPFGWAVFHYGRWVWIAGSGWAWVPGRTYANAWVVWRVPTASYAYVGWAPMPPTWGWFGGVAIGVWYGPPLPYVFCPSAYVFHHHVHHHIVHDRHLVHRIAANTQVYPTSYRTPARPGTRVTSVGSQAAPTSAAPRGPRIAAARVPASAVPAARMAPPLTAARLPPIRPSANPSDVTRSRVVPTDVTRRRVGADSALPHSSALPRSNAPVRPTTDLRRERTVQPPRFGADTPRLRPMPSPMRDFMRTPSPRPRRP